MSVQSTCTVLVFVVVVSAVCVSGSPASEDVHRVQKKSYAGYKLLRTMPISEPKMAEAILMSLDGKQGVHFWTYPKQNQSSDILAAPKLLPHVQSLLNELGVEHDILIHDVNEVLKDENPEAEPEAELEQLTRQATTGHRLTWKSYPRYNDILTFCKYLSESSKSSAGSGGPEIVYGSIGKSTEGRDIVLVRMSTGGGGTKPAIFLDGGMHAREWISPATVTYIMNIMATDSARSRDLLEKFDWYFVPVINVDGYEFTHTGDRFWRKTRSRTSSYLGCKGVDPNRNWAFQWGGAGTSNDPCSDIYRGPRAFSEPETQAVSQAILARKNQIKMYLTFHSYSQLLLVPWGYGKQKPADYNELYSLGMQGKRALEGTYGTQYKIGTAPDLLYSAAGGSDDWAKGGAGIKYSYTFELRDTGRYGFALPAAQIQPVGEETFNAVKAMALGLDTVLKRGQSKVTNPVQAPTQQKPRPGLFPGFPFPLRPQTQSALTEDPVPIDLSGGLAHTH